MAKSEFNRSIFGGYKRDEVELFVMKLQEEKEQFSRKTEKLFEERQELEINYRESENERKRLEAQLLEKEEACVQAANVVHNYEQQMLTLEEEINSLKTANDFLRKQLVRHEIGLPEDVKESIAMASITMEQESAVCETKAEKKSVPMKPVRIVRRKKLENNKKPYLKRMKQFIKNCKIY